MDNKYQYRFPLPFQKMIQKRLTIQIFFASYLNLTFLFYRTVWIHKETNANKGTAMMTFF